MFALSISSIQHLLSHGMVQQTYRSQTELLSDQCLTEMDFAQDAIGLQMMDL